MMDPVAENAETPSEPAWMRELDAEYELLGELGRGGMAVVYRARDRELGREVAIKVVRARYASGDEAVARLAREARTVAQLDHPNIVSLHAVRKLSDQSLALVMQLIPGDTLKGALHKQTFTPEQAERVLHDISRALAYAHGAGVVHRDVKPENIFLDGKTDRALLSDFGVARSLESDADLTATGTAIGTPTYMAPEQIDGGALDGRSDLYALGLVAWEMLTGEKPWAGESLYGVIYRQKHDYLRALDEYRQDIPPRLQFLIEGLLHKNPDRRWGSAARFLALLSQPAPPPGFNDWQASRRRRRRALAPDGGGLVPLAAGVENATLNTMKFRRDDAMAVPDADTPARGFDGDAPVRVPHMSPALAGYAAVEEEERRGGVARFVRFALVTVALAAIAALGIIFARRPGPAVARIDAPLAVSDRPSGIEVPIVAPSTSSAAGAVSDSFPTDAVAARDSAAVIAARDSAAALVLRDSVIADSVRRARERLAARPTVPSAAPLPDSRAARAESLRAEGTRLAAARESGIREERARAESVRVADVRRIEIARAESARLAATRAPSVAVGTPAPLNMTIAVEAGPVAAGGRHTCVIAAAGGAWCWGSNDRGQVGEGDAESGAGSPVRVGASLAFAQITSGGTHTCAVTRGGEVYCWGDNERGQLGDGGGAARNTPTRTASAWSFRVVRAGFAHTCGITRGGELVCWGANESGQLGTGGAATAGTPRAVAVGGRVGAAALGWGHTCAVTTEGELYCWGRNNAGQIGDGTTSDRRSPVRVPLGSGEPMRAVAVAAGNAHSCAATAAGEPLCWGRGGSGQLGVGATVDRITPVRVEGLTSVAALTAGSVHTCARTRGGAAWCWGKNVYGQVGDGTSTDRIAPVRVQGGISFATLSAVGAHTCGATASGETWCWGYNVDGQLGDGRRDNRYRPVKLGIGVER